MKIIVGLGNLDKKYNLTRHNAGFMAADFLAEKNNLKFNLDKKLEAEIAKNNNFILVKPATFMNNSGRAVQKILAYYNLNNPADIKNNLVIIHDDLDIKLGSFKIVTGGSGAGHNGIKSIIEYLNTKDFTRIKLGLATPVLDKARKSIFPGAVARFVLKRFSADELQQLDSAISKAVASIWHKLAFSLN